MSGLPGLLLVSFLGLMVPLWALELGATWFRSAMNSDDDPPRDGVG